MEDTICAISTSVGESGAISIVRLSGKDSVSIVDKIFSNKNFNQAASHTIHYGYILNELEKLDEVLVLKMLAPKTYTTEDVVEINCHGGLTTTNKILETLLLNGARLAEPGEFTKRAFLNGRIDLIEAESVGDLISAKSEKARKLAMNGVTGTLTNLIRSLREKIVGLLANIEVNIDYPEYEDELIITHENLLPNLIEIKESLLKIVKESENGSLIKNGINVALIGRPNVGKSSLLNAFLEEEKAIVTNISGTTRDVIEGNLILNGISLNLLDTAGIRETEDVVEKIGVEKSHQVIAKADLVILVLNNNENITKEDEDLLNLLEDKKNIIFINKSDLSRTIEFEKLENRNIVIGNTVEENGIQSLKDKIVEMFHLEELESKDMNFLSNVREIVLAKNALSNIEESIQEINQNIPIDLLETNIKEAWNQLGLIIGETYEEELVDELFKKFCLGK